MDTVSDNVYEYSSVPRFDAVSARFRSIFSLYTTGPAHPGYREVFGPVYGAGAGCGLCNLFPRCRYQHLHIYILYLYLSIYNSISTVST